VDKDFMNHPRGASAERTTRRHRAVRSLYILFFTFLPALSDGHDTLSFNDIQGVLTSNCGGGSCHINQTTSGVNLTSYETVMASIGTQYAGPIVVPGSPAGSPLIDKVLMPEPRHGLRMPLGAEPLSEEELDMLLDWVSDGAIRSHRPMRGDVDEDETVTLTDAILILQYLFT
jgi:hypothetical protein